MANTILSSGVRNNLLTLQQTTADQGVIQNRLATGRKVNSAIDNPVNFFTSLGLNDRAGQLSGLLDGISNGIQTIQAASKGIDSIVKMVQSLQSTVKQAQNDAVSNRPKISAAPLGNSTEAAARNSSIREVALNKVVVGTAAPAAADDPLTTGVNEATPGNVGVTAAATGSSRAIQITAGATTYTVKMASGSTVRDLVNAINGSGIASASVGDDGRLIVNGAGSDPLSLAFGSTDNTSGAFTATAAATPGTGNNDADALFGAGAGTTVAAADILNVSASGNSTVRTNLIKQFNDLRDQIDGLAKDAGFNGINLLGGDLLSITFNEKTGTNKNKLDIQGSTITAANLGIGKFVDASAGQTNGDFAVQNDTDLGKAADALTNVLSSLRSLSSTLGSNLSVVQTRQDFTKNMINTLTTGADNLVLADSNEEGAKLLALNTRQQLSQTALSLANQADQGVLRLFG